MKKPYSEPDILFESFTLSTNIASGCEEEPNTNTENCGIRSGNFVIFTDEMTGICNRYPGTSGTKYDQYCYHVPNSELNIFFS